MTRKLTEQEVRLWQRVAQTVKPIRAQPVANPSAPPSPPLASTSNRPLDPLPAARRETDQYVANASFPLQDHSGHRRVRRGQFAIDGTIDLHGHTQASARDALLSFVRIQRASGARRLLVITGKGRAGGGMLRRRFTDWINEADFRSHLSGYAPASARHGGQGAFYLLLKRAEPN